MIDKKEINNRVEDSLRYHNQTRLIGSDIKTGKEYRRERRKNKKQKFSDSILQRLRK